MASNQDNQTSRRQFLKAAAALAGTAIVAGTGYSAYRRITEKDLGDEAWHLNPAFRISEVSQNEIELYTNLGNGRQLRHRFSGVEADLLRGLAQEKSMPEITQRLIRIHHISEKKATQQIKNSLHDFARANLVYSGELMKVKIVEATE